MYMGIQIEPRPVAIVRVDGGGGGGLFLVQLYYSSVQRRLSESQSSHK